MLFSYTFKSPLYPHPITADSGKKNRKEAFADLRAYVDANYGTACAPKSAKDIVCETPLTKH